MTREDTVNKQKSRQPKDPKSVPPPHETVAPSKDEKMSFDIDIFRAWCKSCGICAAFCPKHCIRLDSEGSPIITATDECTGCGWCELHCPDFAISVHPRKQPRKSSEAAD
jgi:2-oxoglutarate ferredoxin oxidoreductase subunit delta